MTIQQVAAGAVVAVAVMYGADKPRDAISGVAFVAGTGAAALGAWRQGRNAVVTAVLDGAGEVIARIKQV